MKKRTYMAFSLVTLAAVILCALAITASQRAADHARRVSTQQSIHAILRMADDYKTEAGRHITEAQGLDELAKWVSERQSGIIRGIHHPVDAWGNRMRYQLTENGPVISSAGLDGVFGTSDDIAIEMK
jgi:type II secretory pathway pseudopilin PulG